jgi:hypothetical protein
VQEFGAASGAGGQAVRMILWLNVVLV